MQVLVGILSVSKIIKDKKWIYGETTKIWSPKFGHQMVRIFNDLNN